MTRLVAIVANIGGGLVGAFLSVYVLTMDGELSDPVLLTVLATTLVCSLTVLVGGVVLVASDLSKHRSRARFACLVAGACGGVIAALLLMLTAAVFRAVPVLPLFSWVTLELFGFPCAAIAVVVSNVLAYQRMPTQ